MEETLDKAKKSYKCQQDGETIEDEYMKIASIRTEEGQTICLT